MRFTASGAEDGTGDVVIGIPLRCFSGIEHYKPNDYPMELP
jgi:hypothetical protein